ncbi:MAG: SRPBCC family protein [Chloroflexi bacterium]|nr:SRPBCC family protein [Chloroflexota bacterium]
MPIFSLGFEIQINVSPQTVYDHLRDPHNLVGLQPLLTHVENVQASHTSVSYDTVEAFRWLGIFLYRNRIHVRTTFIDPPQRLETVVHSFPNITLQVGYTFTPQAGGALLRESVQISCHAWLAGFVTDQATHAQTALLENLKTRLEAG